MKDLRAHGALSFGTVSHLLPRASGSTRFLAALQTPASSGALNGKCCTLTMSCRTIHANRSTTVFIVWSVNLWRTRQGGTISRVKLADELQNAFQIESWHAISCTTIGRRLNVLKIPFREVSPRSSQQNTQSLGSGHEFRQLLKLFKRRHARTSTPSRSGHGLSCSGFRSRCTCPGSSIRNRCSALQRSR